MVGNELPVGSEDDNTVDFGTTWEMAIRQYEDITKVEMKALIKAKNVDEIMNNIHERREEFKSFRHDGSKMERFRTLVRKSLDPVQKVGDAVAPVASTSFPPSVAIFTAVRYLFDSAKAVSADYDKIVGFFEDLDVYLNRLKILEKKVPLVPELVAALARVLTSLLVLCGFCAKYVKMKRLGKAFRNLVFGEDQKLTDAYAQFHKMVEQEQGVVRNMTLAGVEQIHQKTSVIQIDVKAALAITERTDGNTKTLIASTDQAHRYLEGREATIERNAILEGLSSLNIYDKQRDVFDRHHPGTGQWLLKTGEFQKWAGGEWNSTLWCPGMPGAGKTVMTSIAVNHVAEMTQGKKAGIAYIYCDYQDARTLSAPHLFSSIIRQLAEQTSPLPAEVKAFYEKDSQMKRNPTDDERISLLRSICHFFQITYIFIDALDVCPETERERFLRLIKKLEPFLRLFATSRPHINLQLKFPNLHRIEIVASSSDIEAYLMSEINTNSRMSGFTAKDSELKEQIITSVNKKANGMFLLAHLQIGHLCKQTNLKTVKRDINALPTEVHATYDDALERIEKQSEEDSQLAKRAISYIFGAKRPLKAEELRHALAVGVGETELDETAFTDTEILLNISAGLIRIDEKSSTARLVHDTLQEYLEKNHGKLLPNLETQVATTCLTYLSFNVFGSGPCSDGESLDERLQVYQFLDYASHHWGHHVVQNQLRMDWILTYLEDEAKVSSFVQVLYLSSHRSTKWYDRFPKKFGPLHVLAYWGLDEILHLLLEKGIDVNSQDSYGTTAIQLAAKYGHDAVVRLLLKEKAYINIENKSGETALYWAARNGHKPIVELLLANGANVMMKDNEGWSALDWAVIEGRNDVVKVLLEQGIEADSEGSMEALIKAAGEGHEVTVQMLLDHGVDVNARDWCGSTALDWAVPAGHEMTVRVLLHNGCNPNSRDKYGNSALHWAVLHEPILQLLLENGADVDAKNTDGQTALCWVARDGSVAAAQLLIEYAADVNIMDGYGCTALHGAALKGREDMLRILLEHGADPIAKDKDGWTPLHAAALKRHEELVQLLFARVDNGTAVLEWVALQEQETWKLALLGRIAEKKAEGSTVVTGLRVAVQEKYFTRTQLLLENGADVNAKDPGGWTALIIAAWAGDTEIVELLLQKGADVNMCGANGWPALHWASEHEEGAVVQLLLKHGADINASIYGWTSMLLAAKKGNLAIVESLIESGADVRTEDYYGRRALHWAAMHGNETMMSLLAAKGADCDAVDRWGRTALIWAIENKQQAVAELLLGFGATVEAKTRDGSTALHMATIMREEVTVQQLLAKGASVEAQTRAKFTALHIAAFLGCEAVVQQLLARGSDIEAKAQWRAVTDGDGEDDDSDDEFDHGDGVVQMAGWKPLSRLLRQIALEEGSVIDVEAQAQGGLTAHELAAINGHVAVQRLLE